MEIENIDGINFLNKMDNNSIDLILTDPPYIISKETGMNKLKKKLSKLAPKKKIKTFADWQKFKQEKGYENDKLKENYIKYGNTSGKKYSYSTDYGEWDKKFTMKKLEKFIELYYKKLKKGGTLIIWFDLWKITPLKELLDKYKFKQIRMIEWIKTNPIPLNQSVNYLSNAREIALLGVKGGKPTFKAKYHKGIYNYPIQSGKNRFHPTQKNLKLFEELINKHSNEGDLVVDTFLGGGTTALACKNLNRNFKGCEIDTEYYNKILTYINNE